MESAGVIFTFPLALSTDVRVASTHAMQNRDKDPNSWEILASAKKMFLLTSQTNEQKVRIVIGKER